MQMNIMQAYHLATRELVAEAHAEAQRLMPHLGEALLAACAGALQHASFQCLVGGRAGRVVGCVVGQAGVGTGAGGGMAEAAAGDGPVDVEQEQAPGRFAPRNPV